MAALGRVSFNFDNVIRSITNLIEEKTENRPNVRLAAKAIVVALTAIAIAAVIAAIVLCSVGYIPLGATLAIVSASTIIAIFSFSVYGRLNIAVDPQLKRYFTIADLNNPIIKILIAAVSPHFDTLKNLYSGPSFSSLDKAVIAQHARTTLNNARVAAKAAYDDTIEHDYAAIDALDAAIDALDAAIAANTSYADTLRDARVAARDALGNALNAQHALGNAFDAQHALDNAVAAQHALDNADAAGDILNATRAALGDYCLDDAFTDAIADAIAATAAAGTAARDAIAAATLAAALAAAKDAAATREAQ